MGIGNVEQEFLTERAIKCKVFRVGVRWSVLARNLLFHGGAVHRQLVLRSCKVCK